MKENSSRKFLSNILLIAVLNAVCIAAEPVVSPEGIPAHQEKQIRAAVPDKPRVAPAKQRRVLIWSIPGHHQ